MNTAVDTTTAILECIDGKDDFLKLEIENGQQLTLGTTDAGDGKEIKELEGGSGCITFTNNNGILQLEAAGCRLPVKINGQPIREGSFRPGDVLRIGDSIWKTYQPGKENVTIASTTNSIRQGFTRLIGLEELKDFKLKDIFSKVFQKHSFWIWKNN